jgi:hypothetical protein
MFILMSLAPALVEMIRLAHSRAVEVASYRELITVLLAMLHEANTELAKERALRLDVVDENRRLRAERAA